MGRAGATPNIDITQIAQKCIRSPCLTAVERTTPLACLGHALWTRSGLTATGYDEVTGECTCGADSDDIPHRLLRCPLTEPHLVNTFTSDEIGTVTSQA